MKCIFLLLSLLCSCSFYSNQVSIQIAGLGEGRIVITSKNFSYEARILNDHLEINLDKGELYAVTFYPTFFGRENRFPSGGIINLQSDYVTVSPYLGILSEICNKMHSIGAELDAENLLELKHKLINNEVSWMYNKEDIKSFLSGKITIGSISKSKIIKIPLLEKYYNWTPENKLFYSWYPSVQSFFNKKTGVLARVEIYQNGDYCEFDEIELRK